ncbi:hypothetical protein EI94DRAFT_599301 [Lactarius quietus]|nr:hypothetical protein EI94DRAFT_599301 [Lactarius quietus]
MRRIRSHSPSPGPFTRLKTSPNDEPTTADVEPMVVDSSMAAPTGRNVPGDALTFIASTLGSLSKYWDDDNSDTAFISALSTIYGVVHASMPSHQSLVNFDQFKKNAAKMGTSGFTDLLRKALGKTELSLWLPVVTHDIFHTVIPSGQDANQIPRELREAGNPTL